MPIESTNSIEGMVEYMSPEQTGRMNRSIDYRSDIYSLGAVIYAISTGGRPLTAMIFGSCLSTSSACLNPPRRQTRVCLSIDNIAKLLIKEPEEARCQSTYAVISDLKKATDLFLLDPDFSENFTVALDDVPEQLSIPNRLYDPESSNW